MGVSLDYKGIEFSVSKKCYHKTESNKDISINVFGHETNIYIYLVLIMNEDKSHSV